jgi:hypothetical protein
MVAMLDEVDQDLKGSCFQPAEVAAFVKFVVRSVEPVVSKGIDPEAPP